MKMERMGRSLGLPIAALALGSLPAAAQVPASAAPASSAATTAATWTPSRTPDGQPDVQGLWNSIIVGAFDLRDPRTGGGRLDELLKERAGVKRIPKPSRIVDPPNGDIPYQPWASAKQKDIAAHVDDPTKPEHIDTQARCIINAPPRSILFSIFQIIQTPGYVTLIHEMNHNFRVIPLEGGPHVGPALQMWKGDSRGHWEGNTLVVDVTNYNGKERLDMVGDFDSPAVHVVERFKFVDANTLDYEATVEDPSVYTRPWKLASRVRKIKDQNYEIWEDACHEGERSSQTMVLSSAPASAAPAK